MNLHMDNLDLDKHRRHVVHAYGVIAAGSKLLLPPTGIGEAPVRLVEAGDLAAVVSPLDEARFGERAWQEHADDPEWLALVAAQHQEVLGALIVDADVLPFRLPAMYADTARVERVLRAEATLFRRGLAAVRDHVEWGVQVFAARDHETPQTPPPQTGRDYLRRRSAEAGERERAREQRHREVLEAYGALADAASDSVMNPPQDPAVSGRRDPMLLNSAHLVVRQREEAFFAVARSIHERLSGSGMYVQVSGPWPAYNFAHLGTEELQEVT